MDHGVKQRSGSRSLQQQVTSLLFPVIMLANGSAMSGRDREPHKTLTLTPAAKATHLLRRHARWPAREGPS